MPANRKNLSILYQILNFKDVLEASGCRIHPTYFSEVFHVDALLIFGISKALLQNLKCAKFNSIIVICTMNLIAVALVE